MSGFFAGVTKIRLILFSTGSNAILEFRGVYKQGDGIIAGKKLIDETEATESACQHKKPCSDCPWSREALAGWLGGVEIEEWLERAHTNTMVPCHVFTNQQCAGMAIYRRNVMKMPRPPLLLLEADKETVFANPQEFTDHHEGPPNL